MHPLPATDPKLFCPCHLLESQGMAVDLGPQTAGEPLLGSDPLLTEMGIHSQDFVLRVKAEVEVSQVEEKELHRKAVRRQ